LPRNFELTVTYYQVAAYYYVRDTDMIPAFHQTDVRLSRHFMLGTAKAEAALTILAADGGHIDYADRVLPAMRLERQAFATLRLEY
jgi:hypothetical protein